ncbi:MAG TPA: exodeoxyribonuclease VII large subunit [Saprospiraceae bacterium]|nr:exodeoxyribonuclease VII large subunit [Saprospiraceae bacterium]HRO07658.1 exodeoxyribonuclease VII large subunit [Saprospiraceae bacterium]HRO73590.1 exodeoxyribonuclease VII large subunit [Saprospiraceae bacterium]HRP40940.1 exodeoxyribonuclease VII large subunit [Saprospiraceae bacterium]
MRQSYSLFELNEYVRRVISLNFPEPIWVNCEISQIKEVKGNVYLDLIYHNEDTGEITAQISANIWYKSFLFLKNKLGEILPSILKEGIHVLLKVQVEFNERYGLKLVIEDIDPAFTIGQMEIQRQKIIQKLTNEGWIDLNKQIKLPNVIQRVAVISALNAAGYKDFTTHLHQNANGYAFRIDLYNAAMQGQNTEREVCAMLQKIGASEIHYDAVLIIRGGGSKIDLSWFDNYNIGVEIARCPYPVITGIGHEIDNTVADIVANTYLKTPTAVADFLININETFESNVNWLVQSIQQIGQRQVKQEEILLNKTIQILALLPSEIIRTHYQSVDQVMKQCFTHTKLLIQKHRNTLDFNEKSISLLNPANVLRKGYAIIRQSNTIIDSKIKYKTSSETCIEFHDGQIIVKPQ